MAMMKKDIWVLAGACALSCITGIMYVQAPLTDGWSWLPIVSVVLLAMPSYFAFVTDVGDKRGGAILMTLSLLAVCIEYIGVTTGLPYGYFTYGTVMGEKLFGVVPWTVMFAWPPLVLSAVYAVRLIKAPILARACVAALLLVVIDLALDPAAVAQGFWSFTHGGQYYNVPWSNYAGWLLSGLLGSSIVLSAIKKSADHISWRTAASAALFIAFFTGVNAANAMYLPAAIGVALLSVFFFVQGKRFVRIYAHLAARRSNQETK